MLFIRLLIIIIAWVTQAECLGYTTLRSPPLCDLVRAANPDRPRYLLMGSAPWVPAWWEKNGATTLELGYKVAALNNAWSLVKAGNTSIWYVPNDFARFGKKHPTDSDMEHMGEVRISGGRIDLKLLNPSATQPNSKVNARMFGVKNCYGPASIRNEWGEVMTTMFFNGLYDLVINVENPDLASRMGPGCSLDGIFPEFAAASRFDIVILGCDMSYPPGQVAFYPGGSKDPLRYKSNSHSHAAEFGKLVPQWPRSEMSHARQLVQRMGAAVYNFGGQSGGTTLPFEKVDFPVLQQKCAAVDARDVEMTRGYEWTRDVVANLKSEKVAITKADELRAISDTALS